jgi:YesN/AraC family two-component response regulator
LLAARKDAEVCAVELVDKFKPDVLLLDISMPGKNGLEVTSIVREQFPGTPKC